MFLDSIATAVPDHSFTQVECLEALRESRMIESLKPRSRGLLEKVLGNGVSQIDSRQFCLSDIPQLV